ncbi:Gfo/Idh/MocA family oxidoreductase [Paludisphaera rhizosphaerae]|uniref:hypothetical protein n=1 Tax=Paludisphaera rhizosphaerae TaxID=2711216 RepID=UPI0013EA047D|nr:hypothetical protein [Paludisphaera rhizosphaerae]
MKSDQSRRAFLESVGLAAGAGAALGTGRAAASEEAPRRPKIAALTSTYFYLSHGYHIVGRFLDGFPVYDGGPGRTPEQNLHRPPFDVASLYIEQVADDSDLGRAKAARHGVRLSPTIADALTLGTGKLAVDGVLLIAEHGEYPLNEKLQKLYPRHAYFQKVLEVFRASGKVAPIFVDKHLSYSRAEAAEMVSQAEAMGVPLMAGSSLPVTWRLPEMEIPLGRPMKDVLVASRGNLEIFGFHALEVLQCMAERRDLRGRPQGVAAVTYLEGDAVWQAADRGVWSWELLSHALGRSHTVNPGDVRQNTRDFKRPGVRDRETIFDFPVAFVVEYVDGLRGTVLILNGHVDDTTVAVRTTDGAGRETIASTLTYLPAPPGASFFNPLVLRIEDFFHAGAPPCPVRRTQLSGGILDAALESRIKGGARIETPDLAAIDYKAPADSAFIRSPLTDPTPNRL